MRTHIARLAALALLMTSACGGVAAPGSSTDGKDVPISHPTGADELVLRVEHSGGFVPVEYTLSAIPGFSLYGDGTVLTQGPMIEIYPPPAVPSILQQKVDEQGMQAILQAASAAGLTDGDQTYDAMASFVTDVGSMVFTVTADDSTSVTSIYALGMAQDPGIQIPEDERKADEQLAAFSDKLNTLDTWLPEGSVTPFNSDYRTTEMRVYARDYGKPTDPSLTQEPVDWPLTTPLADFGDAPVPDSATDARCGTFSGSDLDTLLPVAQASNTETPWVSEGKEYRLIFRPLLPDESGC